MMLAIAAATRRQFLVGKTGKRIRADQRKAEHNDQQGCPDATHCCKCTPKNWLFPTPKLITVENSRPACSSVELAARRPPTLSECHQPLSYAPLGPDCLSVRVTRTAAHFPPVVAQCLPKLSATACGSESLLIFSPSHSRFAPSTVCPAWRLVPTATKDPREPCHNLLRFGRDYILFTPLLHTRNAPCLTISSRDSSVANTHVRP